MHAASRHGTPSLTSLPKDDATDEAEGLDPLYNQGLDYLQSCKTK